jgi:hypothetical protein
VYSIRSFSFALLCSHSSSSWNVVSISVEHTLRNWKIPDWVWWWLQMLLQKCRTVHETSKETVRRVLGGSEPKNN